MVVSRFPPVETADESGLLAVGGDLEVDSLLLAYRSGIFPWPIIGFDELPWFAPPERAILFFDELRVPERLQRRRKNSGFSFSIDTAFLEVISACAQSPNRKRGSETWITEEMLVAYSALHRAGYCHSVEAYLDGRLVGGMYGVSIGLMFAGESMFYRESDASKLCLLHLIEVAAARGASWIDCQQLTPLVQSLGARLVPRRQFSKLLSTAVKSAQRIF